MKKEHLDYFKELLQKELAAITAELRDQKSEQEELLHPEVGDPADQATEGVREMLDQVTQHETNLMRKIKLALQRIEQGTYGTCIECGSDISMNRLKAKPSVSLCYQCQRKKECAP